MRWQSLRPTTVADAGRGATVLEAWALYRN